MAAQVADEPHECCSLSRGDTDEREAAACSREAAGDSSEDKSADSKSTTERSDGVDSSGGSEHRYSDLA